MATDGEWNRAFNFSTGTAVPFIREERLPWAMPSSQEIRETLAQGSTSKDTEEAWAKTAEEVKQYSDDVITEWNSEIDYFLVYSGIFSTILTAFVISTYPTLQSLSSYPALVPRTRSYEDLSSERINADVPSSIPQSVVTTNILFFCSLVCGLAATFFGLMVKQWLHDYRAIRQCTVRHTARLRLFRLNNIIAWRVPTIISSLFVLLQASLGLFFGGVLVLVWNIHRPLALVVSFLVAIIGVFLMVTTFLPIIYSTCCYITPLTRILLHLFDLFQHVLHLLRRRLLRHALHAFTRLSILFDILSSHLPRRSAARDDDALRRNMPVGTRCPRTNGSARGLPKWLIDEHRSLERVKRKDFTWQGREAKSIMRTSEALDSDLVTATVLGRLATPGKQATIDVVYPLVADLGPRQASECLSAVHEAMEEELPTDPRVKDTGLVYMTSTIPLDFWIAALPGMISYISYGEEVLFQYERQGFSAQHNTVFWRQSVIDRLSTSVRSVLRRVRLGPAVDILDQIERHPMSQPHVALDPSARGWHPKVEQLVDPALLQQCEKHVANTLRYIYRDFLVRGTEYNVFRDRRLLLVLSWCAYTIGGESRDYSIYLLHLLLCRSRNKDRRNIYSWRLISYLLVAMEQRFEEIVSLLGLASEMDSLDPTQPVLLGNTASHGRTPEEDVQGAKILKVSEIIIFCCMKRPDFWEGTKQWEDAVASHNFASRVLRFLSGLVAPGKLLSPSADMAKLEYVADMLASIVDVLAESQDGRELYKDVLDNENEVVRTWIRQARLKIPMVLVSQAVITANNSVGRLADAMDRITSRLEDDAHKPAGPALRLIRSKSVSHAAGSG